MNKEEQVIMGFRELINKMDKLNNNTMKDSLKSCTASEIHCIEYIGKNVDANMVKLAEAFYMTRGAMSKMTKKLIKKGIVESYQKPNNKKLVYFKLTEQGKEIYNIHEEMHRAYQKRDKAVFDQVTEEQLDIMLGFANKYGQHLDSELNKLGVGKPK